MLLHTQSYFLPLSCNSIRFLIHSGSLTESARSLLLSRLCLHTLGVGPDPWGRGLPRGRGNSVMLLMYSYKSH